MGLGDSGIQGAGRRSETRKAAREGAAREAGGEQGRITLWNPRGIEESHRNQVVGVYVFHNQGHEQLPSPSFSKFN